MTVHLYILQQFLAYIFYSIRYPAKEKKKHPATVVVWLGAWFVGSCGRLFGCFCVVCCLVAVRGYPFWLVFGLFWACFGCSLINCLPVALSCVLRAFFGFVWCACFLGVMQNKKDNKKTGFNCCPFSLS